MSSYEDIKLIFTPPSSSKPKKLRFKDLYDAAERELNRLEKKESIQGWLEETERKKFKEACKKVANRLLYPQLGDEEAYVEMLKGNEKICIQVTKYINKERQKYLDMLSEYEAKKSLALNIPLTKNENEEDDSEDRHDNGYPEGIIWDDSSDDESTEEETYSVCYVSSKPTVATLKDSFIFTSSALLRYENKLFYATRHHGKWELKDVTPKDDLNKVDLKKINEFDALFRNKPQAVDLEKIGEIGDKIHLRSNSTGNIYSAKKKDDGWDIKKIKSNSVPTIIKPNIPKRQFKDNEYVKLSKEEFNKVLSIIDLPRPEEPPTIIQNINALKKILDPKIKDKNAHEILTLELNSIKKYEEDMQGPLGEEIRKDRSPLALRILQAIGLAALTVFTGGVGLAVACGVSKLATGDAEFWKSTRAKIVENADEGYQKNSALKNEK